MSLFVFSLETMDDPGGTVRVEADTPDQKGDVTLDIGDEDVRALVEMALRDTPQLFGHRPAGKGRLMLTPKTVLAILRNDEYTKTLGPIQIGGETFDIVQPELAPNRVH